MGIISTWYSRQNKLMMKGLIAAVAIAGMRTLDNVVVNNYITAPDGMIAALAYLAVGGWLGVISTLIYSLFFGKKYIDSDFQGFVFHNREMHKEAFISGVIAAIATLFYLWGNQFGDAGVMTALASAIIIYTALYDVYKGQIRLSTVFWPVVLVVASSFMTAYTGNITLTIKAILLVLIFSNLISTIGEVSEQKGARASDAVNFGFWRFLWLAITGTTLGIVLSIYKGLWGLYQETIKHALSPHVLLWICGVMFCAFLGLGIRYTLKKSHAISAVLIVTSAQVLMAFPLMALGRYLSPQLFGQWESITPFVWGIRLVGAVLLGVGIYILNKRLPRED